MDPLHLSWARQLVGPVRVERVTGTAWRLVGERRACWLKRHRPGRAWRQADGAHDVVLPALREAGVAVPERLARWPEERLLLLSEVEGRPGTLDDPPEVFEAVGRILRRLHSLPCPQDDIPLGAAMAARARAAAARWPSDEAEWVVQLVGDGAILGGPRAWCHRDVQPRNWVVGPTVGLVDFEHLRPDHPTMDFVRLEARGVAGERRAALYEGYGSEPDLRVALALYGLQTVVWARDHADPELEAIGLGALTQV